MFVTDGFEFGDGGRQAVYTQILLVGKVGLHYSWQNVQTGRLAVVKSPDHTCFRNVTALNVALAGGWFAHWVILWRGIRNTLSFYARLDRETPRGLDLHLIVDNYSTHKHDNVTAGLTSHKRFHIHYPSTSSSWLNLLERWFRELTTKRLHRGNFTGVNQLIAAIDQYLAKHNKEAKPFVWTASAQQIIDKLKTL